MRKTYTSGEALSLVRKIERSRAKGLRVYKACMEAGVTDTTYYRWREQFKHLLFKASNDNMINLT